MLKQRTVLHGEWRCLFSECFHAPKRCMKCCEPAFYWGKLISQIISLAFGQVFRSHFCCTSFSLLSCLLAGGGSNFGENAFAVFRFFLHFLQKRLRGSGGFESLTCWSSEDFSLRMCSGGPISQPSEEAEDGDGGRWIFRAEFAA